MRVLICTNAYPPHFMGGAELVAHEQAKSLMALGHKVAVFAGDIGAEGPRHSRSEDRFEGVDVVRIRTTQEDYSVRHLNFIHPAVEGHFSDVLSKFRPDLVHFHNLIGLSVKLPIIARRAGVTTVCTLHDFWGFCAMNTGVRPDGQDCETSVVCTCTGRLHDGRGLHVAPRFRKDMLRLAFEHFDHLISPSRYVAGRYVASGLVDDRIHVLPNGVQAFGSSATPMIEPARVTVAYVGYFGQHKGVSTLISAMSLIDKCLDVHLNLAGDGPEADNYRAQIEALGLADRVHFLGKVPHQDIAGVYEASSIVCLTSLWGENQPVCLMEAMRAARPIVASRKGGIPELVEDGRNGLLFEAGDAQSLAACLTTLAKDAALRLRMGREGEKRVSEQTYRNQAKLNVDIYRADRTRTKARALVMVVGSLRRKLSRREAARLDEQHPDKLFIPSSWRTGCDLSFDYVWLRLPLWRDFAIDVRPLRRLRREKKRLA